MKDLLSIPDKHLRYVSHEISETNITIKLRSVCKKASCPYCGETSSKVHSHYTRALHDLPIQGKKVKLLIDNKKFFCKNKECSHNTFAEPFLFFEPRATKTKRLQEEILRVSLSQSSLSAAKYLRNSVVDVGKSTICNMLKKTRKDHKQ